MNADVTVRELMTHDYVGVSESDGVLETVELMLEESVDSVVVLRGSEPVGLMSARDVLGLLTESGLDKATVDQAMSRTVPSISPDEKIDEAAAMMNAESASGLLVTNGDEPLGVVTRRDLFSAAILEPPEEIEPLATAGVTETRATTDEGFADQGVCEECGTLVRDLAEFGGQLLCPDCRSL